MERIIIMTFELGQIVENPKLKYFDIRDGTWYRKNKKDKDQNSILTF